MLFDQVCNSHWFIDTSMVMFMNKTDIFRAKIQYSPIRAYFPDYSGNLSHRLSKLWLCCCLSRCIAIQSNEPWTLTVYLRSRSYSNFLSLQTQTNRSRRRLWWSDRLLPVAVHAPEPEWAQRSIYPLHRCNWHQPPPKHHGFRQQHYPRPQQLCHPPLKVLIFLIRSMEGEGKGGKERRKIFYIFNLFFVQIMTNIAVATWRLNPREKVAFFISP